ncbi:hypothetical protein [Pseudomonas cerasi]
MDLRRLFAAIDADPAIAGAGVVYLDSQLWPVTLREFQPICSVLPKRVILREMPASMARLDYVRRLEHEPRESQLVFEAINASLSCGAAVLGWLVVLSGSVGSAMGLIRSYRNGHVGSTTTIAVGLYEEVAE